MQIDSAEEGLKSHHRSIEYVEGQLAKAEDALRREKEALDTELAAFADEMKSVEERAEYMKAALAQGVDAARELDVTTLSKLVEE